MANFKTNAMRILDSNHIPYTMHEYKSGGKPLSGVEVAALLQVDVFLIYKTLIAQGATGQYYVFIIPAARELSLKLAANAAGEKSVSMAKQNDLMKITGYVRGGVSPIGMKKNYPTFIDSSCLNLEKIIVSAGKIGYQVELSPPDLISLVNCKSAAITQA